MHEILKCDFPVVRKWEGEEFSINIKPLVQIIESLKKEATTTAMKKSLKGEFTSFQTFSRLFGPAQFRRFFPGGVFLRSRFKKRKENSSMYVYVLHKTSH